MYGPSSIRDFAWWANISLTKVCSDLTCCNLYAMLLTYCQARGALARIVDLLVGVSVENFHSEELLMPAWEVWQ